MFHGFLMEEFALRHSSRFGINVLKGLLTAACMSPVLHAAEVSKPINLHYNERPPFTSLVDGAVVGLVAAPIETAFRKAGIAFKWVDTPVARQFLMVKADSGQDCLAGRFKNADRESWARFSKPVYQDQPQGLMVRSDTAKAVTFSKLEEAVSAPDFRLLVKLSYSYGATIDRWLEQRNPPARTTSDENLSMLRQINQRMADGFIIAAEEAQGLIKQSGLPPANFQLLKFPDAPEGELRYIMCSRQVPQETMDRLNSAISWRPR